MKNTFPFWLIKPLALLLAVAALGTLAACPPESPLRFTVDTSLSAANLTLYTETDTAGKPLTLSISPAGAAAVADYTWTVTPSGAVQINTGTPPSAEALILPQTPGQAVITVRATPKPGLSFDRTVVETCTLTVIEGVPPTPVTGISVSQTSPLSLVQSRTSNDITVTITPSNATNQNYICSAVPAAAVEILSGTDSNQFKIQSVGLDGSVVITVRAADETNGIKQRTFTVNIEPLVVTFVTGYGTEAKYGVYPPLWLHARVDNLPNYTDWQNAKLTWEIVPGPNSDHVALGTQQHGHNNEKAQVSLPQMIASTEFVTIRARSLFDSTKYADFILILSPELP